jgi:transposase-like protein
MPRSRTRASARKARPDARVTTIQVPLPLLDVLADAKTAFFGLCVTAGQQVFQAMMEHDRAQLCGPKNVPNPTRQAYRGGSVPSEVVLGGRRIVLPRLRARSVTGEELALPSFAYASARDPLDAHTLEAIAVGVTTRKYARTLEPLPADVVERAVSKSAVSRRFVGLTSARLTTWLATPLEGLDIRIILIDALHFRDHIILLALGLDAQGRKHILALREGTTENAAVCTALLADVRERGLDLDRPTLFIIDGGTGLRKAIRGHCGTLGLVQRCQVHKVRNVLEHLPETLRPRIRRAMAEAYGLADADLAKRRLTQLAKGLERAHPGAAASLREGLAETLTLQGLGVTGALYRTLRSTNAIENLNGLIGRFVRNVRRWRDGRMLVRWIAAALDEAKRSFRRVRGHADLAALIRALDAHALDTKLDTKKEVA